MSKPQPGMNWIRPDRAIRIVQQVPDNRAWTWESDGGGGWRVLYEQIDGATYDYTYDANGNLASIIRRPTS